MSIFEEAVKERGRIIKEASALGPESIPAKKPVCRDWHLDYLARKLSAGLQTENQAPNLFAFGPPGTGKTYCVRWVIKELEKYVEKQKLPVKTVYVNAGKTRTAYFTMLEICRSLGISVPSAGWQMFRLKQEYEKLCSTHQIVLAIDEFETLIHKEKEPLVYYLGRQPNTSLILISNKFNDYYDLPKKALSSLMLTPILFQPYDEEETLYLLKLKVEEAFSSNIFSEEALGLIARLSSKLRDLRIGLKLLYQLGEWAERTGKSRIEIEDARELVGREVRIKGLESVHGQLEKLSGLRQ